MMTRWRIMPQLTLLNPSSSDCSLSHANAVHTTQASRKRLSFVSTCNSVLMTDSENPLKVVWVLHETTTLTLPRRTMPHRYGNLFRQPLCCAWLHLWTLWLCACIWCTVCACTHAWIHACMRTRGSTVCLPIYATMHACIYVDEPA